MVGKSEGGDPMKESRKGTETGSSGSPEASSQRRSNSQNKQAEYLDGQMLIAMPVMDDERFQRTVIYMCAHSAEGAMGIIVNRPAGSIDFPGLLLHGLLGLFQELTIRGHVGRGRRRHAIRQIRLGWKRRLLSGE